MKTSIISTACGYRIQMADAFRSRTEALGVRAFEQIRTQNPHRWASASDGKFLGLLRQGATIVRTIGLYAILSLSDEEAHCAFMACRFLALRIELLDPRERRSLQHLLIILARCCDIELQPAVIPLAENAPHSLRSMGHLAAAYHGLQRSNRIPLATALQLSRVLAKSGPEFAALCEALNQGTEGLRDALLRTRGVDKTAQARCA